jgi:hypothetical protein
MHVDIPVAEYTNDDLPFCAVFLSIEAAAKFEDAMRDMKQQPFSLRVDTEIIEGGARGDRIWKEHYKGQDGSPPVTESVSVVSGVTDDSPPSTELKEFQSIESPNYLYGCEKAHMFGTKEGAPDGVKNNRNNVMALSRELHGYLDALGDLPYPLIRLDTRGESGPCEIDATRTNVVVVVECLTMSAARNVGVRLKSGAKDQLNEAGRKEYTVSVAVKDPAEFTEFVRQKRLATTRIWTEQRLV